MHLTGHLMKKALDFRICDAHAFMKATMKYLLVPANCKTQESRAGRQGCAIQAHILPNCMKILVLKARINLPSCAGLLSHAHPHFLKRFGALPVPKLGKPPRIESSLKVSQLPSDEQRPSLILQQLDNLLASFVLAFFVEKV